MVNIWRGNDDGAVHTPATYLNAAAHDMKMPLVLINGLAAELARGGYTDVHTREQALRRILLSSEHLLGVVDGIATMNMVHKKQLELPLGPVSIPHVLRSVAADIHPFAHEREQHIIARVSSSLPTVYAHSSSLYRVLYSLLDSTVRHGDTTYNAPIEVKTRLSDAQVHISVLDPYASVKPGEFERIASTFGKIDEPIRDQAGTSGIHLFIAHQLMSAMGGTIKVRASDRGSRMLLALPVTPQLSLFEV